MFVPKHLDSQINQWISHYLFQLIGHVIEDLIQRGTLRKPDGTRPLTNGVFYVAGDNIQP